MEKMMAYCGLTCTGCPAFTATQANDQAALEKVAAQWREQFNAPEITADVILCDGCTAVPVGRLSGYCTTCQIRACATEVMKVSSCAYCDEYGKCTVLNTFLVHAPEAKRALETMRQAL